MDNQVAETSNKLPMSCFIKLDGADREIFMSFALLNRLAYLLGDIEQLGQVHLNPEMREAFLAELLAERGKGGMVTRAYVLGEKEISLEDTSKLLDFASEHVLDFTLGAIEKAMALQAKNQARMLNLKSMQTGQAS